MGVEEEMLLVDPGSGRPVGMAEPVRSTGPGAELDGELRAEQVETGSDPTRDPDALERDLRDRRAAAVAAAEQEGIVVAALATSPLAPDPARLPPGRYTDIADRFGAVASEQLTNGQHVHVEIASREEGVGVLDRIGPWLPVLRALSANSPYWRGEDTGYASYRSMVWSRWPQAGPTPVFGSVEAYDATITAMLDGGTVLDEAMVYFDARLAAGQSTVEVRVADVSTDVEVAVLVAVLSRALVTTAAAAWAAGEPALDVPVPALRLAHWRAARSGVTEELVDPRTGRPAPAADVLAGLREHVADALDEAGDAERAADGCARVLGGGAGAVRQRAASAGGDDLRAVVLDAVERTRT